MSEAVSWLLELAVKPGQLESLRELVEEMVESTRGEPGTLSYEWFVDDAGEVVHIYERYVDSAAAIAHGETFAERFAERFGACVEVKTFNLYGDPSAELKDGLSVFSPNCLGWLGGFTR